MNRPYSYHHKHNRTLYAQSVLLQDNGEKPHIDEDQTTVALRNTTLETHTVISDGNCVINGMKDYDEATSLATFIRVGAVKKKMRAQGLFASDRNNQMRKAQENP